MDQAGSVNTNRKKLIGPRVGIWLSVVLLLAITWQTALSLSARDGKDANARAERDTTNLSHTIAEQTLRAVADTDRILRFVAFDIARLGASDARLGDILRDATSSSDLLLQISFTNAEGDLLQTSVQSGAGKVNLADREHFLVHRNSPDAGLFISKPVFGRASGRWSIQLTRRITMPDGSFGGIVVASLDPFYFSRTFDTLDVGQTGVVAMIGHDGALRARTKLSDQNIGQNVSNSPLFAAAQKQSSGFLRVVSLIDRVPRLISYRTVGDYPLYIYAGFGEAEFMAGTNQRQRTYLMAAGLASVLLLVLGGLANWQVRTDRRARYNAERSSRLKSAFLATISHELRTPMNGVLGMLALLHHSKLDPEQAHHIELARRSAASLLTLLDDILDFSKLEAGKLTVEATDFELRAVIRDVMDVLMISAAEKGIELRLEIAPTVPDRLRTDPTRLRQILFNLLGNALKFTEIGHIKLSVGCGEAMEDGRFPLEVAIEDTGIGIGPEALPTLFDHFTQADTSITRRYGGSGLGLAICRHLCRQLGGTIGVVSTVGKGSVFRFTILCAPAAEQLVARIVEGPTAAVRPLSILVVDDMAINRDVLKGMLLHEGHRVRLATSGAEAIAAVAAEQFDAVLMDVQMPVMDGFAATKQIRTLPAPFGQVPIIAVTAHAGASDRAACLAAGMTGFVTKPVMWPALRAELLGLPPTNLTAEPKTLPKEDLLDTRQIGVLFEIFGLDTWRREIEAFASEAEAEIVKLQHAWAQGDSIRVPAHTLKGIAANMGAAALAVQAGQLETVSGGDAATSVIDNLRELLGESVIAMRLRSVELAQTLEKKENCASEVAHAS